MKHKVCFIISSLHGGGAERVISLLGNQFYKQGFQVTMVCLTKKKPSYPLHEGVKIVNLVDRVFEDRPLIRLKYILQTFVRLIKVLRTEKPLGVISFMTTSNLWTGLVCQMLRIPYIVSERITPDYTINKHKHLLKWFSFNVYSKSKAIVVPSKGMIRSFEKNKAYKGLSNFKVVHNPVNAFSPGTKAEVHPRKFILAVGRLHRQKGFDLLIEAFSSLKTKDIDLLISGEGSERENLSRQIKNLGMEDQIKLIGFKDNLQDYYQQAELFVLSSRFEGYPNALVEAMSMGCACISTNCDFGPSEIIENGQNGILVESESAQQLAFGMARLIESDDLRRKLAANAEHIKQTNAIENISAHWEKIILSHV